MSVQITTVFGIFTAKIITLQLRVSLHHRTDKGKTSTLTSQRTVADTGKITILIKTILLINRHDTRVLHPAILHDQVENQFPGLIHILIVTHVHMLQNLGGRKHGTGIKETGEMIPGEMVNQRVVGNLKDFLLKVLSNP